MSSPEMNDIDPVLTQLAVQLVALLFRILYKKPQTRWLMKHTFISQCPGGGKSKIKGPGGLMYSNSSLYDLQLATFLLYLHKGRK